MTAEVRVDTSDLVRGAARLAKNVEAGGRRCAQRAAADTAASIAAATPKRTGRLAATVTAVRTADGWGVTYGGGLRYARPVAARTRSVARGIAGRPDRYGRDTRAMTRSEIGRL